MTLLSDQLAITEEVGFFYDPQDGAKYPVPKHLNHLWERQLELQNRTVFAAIRKGKLDSDAVVLYTVA
jgi:hypothetical protein